MTQLFRLDLQGPDARPTRDITGATLADALLIGDDDSEIIVPGSVVSIRLDGVRQLLRRKLNVDPAALATMPHARQNQIVERLRHIVEREFRRQHPQEWAKLIAASTTRETVDQMVHERTALHKALRLWANGPLQLEKPQGSSYHHLVEYDAATRIPGNPTMVELTARYGEPEHVVVENDWARAMAGKDVGGEIRMPWPHVCWEFRISGVRVMAFVRCGESAASGNFFCVYGRDDCWVADDYVYFLDESCGIRTKKPHLALDMDGAAMDPVEFPRVSALVWANIRAACILLDVQAVQRESVTASPRLVRQRQEARRPPPRDYEVVRLARAARPRYARSAGAGTGGGRAPQRGHLRRGAWVHFDDQDSGEFKYLNSGGFWVSKTWRRWHWAGDLDNMIEREYRL